MLVETVPDAATVEHQATPAVPILFVGALASAAALLAVGQPVLALVAIGGTLLLIMLAARADVALVLLVALSPLESSFRLTDSEFLSATKLAGAVAFGSFALLSLMSRRKILVDRSHVLLFALLALGLVSSLFARSFEAGASTTLRYASFVGLYFVVTQYIGDHRLLKRLATALVAASAGAAAMALWNFFVVGAPLARPRYGDPNDLGFILATAIPIGMWLAMYGDARRRMLAVVLTAIVATGLLLTFSRGAMLGLGVGLVWHALTDRRHVRVLVAAGAVAIAFAAALVQVNAETVAAALGAKSRISDYNVESRFVAWAGALELAADHPVIGIGPGNFGLYYYELTDSPPGTFALQVTHNAYLDMASEIGFVGLGLFLAFLIMSFGRLTIVVHRGRGPPGLAAAARTALIVAVVGLLTHSQQYFIPIWLFGAIGTSMWKERQSGSSM